MNNAGHHRSRQPTLPPLSSRTLHHPSFMPMFIPAGFARHLPACRHQTVLPIIPAEFFYIDPTMSCGQRVPNIVTELGVLDCFQLNTPTPVMSAFPAPPTRPDPFRSGPHPTRDLGRLTFTVNTLHLPVQPNRLVLQLTQEEDQAITNLLKLHHQEEPLHWGSAEGVVEPTCNAREATLQSPLQQGRCWSDTELEAAHTLLNGFGLMEKDNILGQIHCKSAATRPDDSSTNAETQHRSEHNFPPLITADCAQNEVGYMDFSCASECGEQCWGDLEFVEVMNADDSEVERWTLSDLEGDAVRGLLSLGDTGALAIVQRSS